jgi:hypothetical protein
VPTASHPQSGYPRDRRRRFARLKPTVAAHPRAALRVPVASRARENFERPAPEAVIAPPTESRRWPEPPSSVRHFLLGETWRSALRSMHLVPKVSLRVSGNSEHISEPPDLPIVVAAAVVVSHKQLIREDCCEDLSLVVGKSAMPGPCVEFEVRLEPAVEGLDRLAAPPIEALARTKKGTQLFFGF